MTKQASLRSRAFLATVALLVAAACGGDARPTPTPGAGSVPTANPFPTVPEPTIVTGSGTPASSATPGAGGATGEQIHTVVAGDTITGLADKYDIPSAQIRALNNLTSDALSLGQRVRIPARSTSPVPTAAPGTGTTSHTVIAGDTALGIALKYDTTVEALERANSVAKGGLDRLQLGQVVKLPPPGQR